jgi:hypothetical protein
VRALVSVLYYMAHTQPEDALLRLQAVLPAVPGVASPYTSRIAAHALRTAGQFDAALAMYADALLHVRADSAWHATQHMAIIEGIAECKRLRRAAQPWWKVW